MLPLQYTIFILVKVILAFFILYIFLPSRIITFDEEGNDWTDKIFISLTHSNFVIIVLVHLLVLLKIYETISLFIVLIMVFAVYYILNSKYIISHFSVEDNQNKNFLSVLLDLVDGRLGLFGGFKTSVKNFFKNAPSKIFKGIIHSFKHPFGGILLIATFVVVAIIRFRHSFEHLYYGASDCYVHLAWTKYLGINKIYQDGVYPYGYEAIISALQKLFFIDPVVIIRFFGGIGSLLLVFSIYYILRKNLKNQYLIIFIGVLGYVFGTEFPDAGSNIWRQMSALPQEYATIFLLPGMHFLNVFFITNRKKYLVLAAEALAITVFIHFYAAIFLGVGYVVLSLMYANKIFKPKMFLQLLTYMGSAGIIGLAPILIALSLGMKFHALSLGFVAESAKLTTTLDWKFEIFKYVETNPTLRLLLICFAVLIVYALLRLFFKKSPEYLGKIKLFIPIGFLAFFTYTQVRSPDIGFPAIMEPYRASSFLCVFSVALYAMTIYIIEFIPIHKLIRYIVKLAMIVLIFTTVFQIQNYKLLLPEGAKLEYEQSAYAYYKIKSDFPMLNWTIISPVEQYQESLGYGWHTNLWEFVKDTQVEKKDKVTFPTDYVFVIVEKRPLNQAEPDELTPYVTMEDASQPFPDVGYAYEKFYTVYKNRRILEAKAYYWMEDYVKQKGKFETYIDNDLIKVYKLKQDGTKPINLVN